MAHKPPKHIMHTHMHHTQIETERKKRAEREKETERITNINKTLKACKRCMKIDYTWVYKILLINLNLFKS